MKFLTHWNHDPNEAKGYTSDLPNLAIPDESYSLRDLFAKYTGGKSIESTVREGSYDDPNAPLDSPLAPNRLHLTDPVDVECHMAEVKEYVEHVQEIVADKLNKVSDNQQNKPINKQQVSKANLNDNATTIHDDAMTN